MGNINSRDPRLRWIVKNVSGNRILDIGFVAQEAIVHKALKSCHMLVGLDIDKITVLKLRIPILVVGDAFHLPFKASIFDSCLLAEVIEHTINPGPIFLEINRVLKKGGKLILTTPNPMALNRIVFWLLKNKLHKKTIKKFHGDPTHKVFWHPLSLVNVLNDFNFRIVELTSKRYYTYWIAKHFPEFNYVDLKFFPFNWLGLNTCLVAEKVTR